MNFSDYGISLPNGAVGQTTTVCPQCSHKRKPANQKMPCLSVNIPDGIWNCHHCGWSGKLTDNYQPQKAVSTPVRKNRPELLPLTDNALRWLRSRNIDDGAAFGFCLKSCHAYFRPLGGEAEAIAFPFYRGGNIVNVKYRSLDGKHFTQENGGEQVWYNADSLDGSDAVIVTEGEMDALALRSVGYQAVVSCPSGAPSLKTKDFTNKLSFIDDSEIEHVKNFVLAMDLDEVGLKWEKVIADRLGRWRCSSIDYPEGVKDCNELLIKHGRDAVVKAISEAKPYPIQGVSTFRDQENIIVDYFENPHKSEGLTTGWRVFDEYFRLMPGTLNVLTGIPGSGKSEWLDQLMLGAMSKNQFRWAVFSPENYPMEFHFQKLAEKMLRKPMFKKWSMDPMNIDEVRKCVDALSFYFQFLTFDDEASTIDGILNRFELCIRKYNVRGCVIDPYNEIEHSRPSHLTETEYISSFLSRCRNFARKHNIVLFIVAHPTKLAKDKTGKYPVPTAYDISGSANWRNKADNIISVWRSYQENDYETHIHVQKVRNKNNGKLGMVKFDWLPATGFYTEKPN